MGQAESAESPSTQPSLEDAGVSSNVEEGESHKGEAVAGAPGLVGVSGNSAGGDDAAHQQAEEVTMQPPSAPETAQAKPVRAVAPVAAPAAALVLAAAAPTPSSARSLRIKASDPARDGDATLVSGVRWVCCSQATDAVPECLFSTLPV